MAMKSEKERFHVARSASVRPAGTDLVHQKRKPPQNIQTIEVLKSCKGMSERIYGELLQKQTNKPVKPQVTLLDYYFHAI